MRYGYETKSWTARDIGIDAVRDNQDNAKYILGIGTTIFTVEGSRAFVRHRCAELLRQDRRGERAF